MQEDILRKYIANKNFNIFEQGVDEQTLLDFRNFRENVDIRELQIENLEQDIANLYNENISGYQLKLILVRLSGIADIKVYRTLEKFVKSAEGEIKKWAVIAMQYSRSLIEALLSDGDKILIISGLGGKGTKLRYFTLINSLDLKPFTKWQKETLEKELCYNAELNSIDIEEIKFEENYLTILLLAPIDKNILNFFQTVISNVNELGNFLSEIAIVTNTQKLTKEVIENYLKNGVKAFDNMNFEEEYEIQFNDYNDDDDDDDDDFEDDDDDDDFDEYDLNEFEDDFDYNLDDDYDEDYEDSFDDDENFNDGI